MVNMAHAIFSKNRKFPGVKFESFRMLMWWQGLHPEITPDQTWGLAHWEPDAGLRLSDNPSLTSAEEAVMLCVWCVWCGVCGVYVCSHVSQAHRVRATQAP